MISDVCEGQTRNQFIAALCLFLVTKIRNLELIDQILMVSGHSHMEVDSMHAWTELASDTWNIYVPYEWAIVASVARKNPYVVDLLEYSDIKDLKMLRNNMKLANFIVNTNGEPVHWASSKGYSSNNIVQWLQYRKAEPDKIFYRINYNEIKPFSEILVRQKTRKQALPKLVPAYTQASNFQQKVGWFVETMWRLRFQRDFITTMRASLVAELMTSLLLMKIKMMTWSPKNND